MLLLSLAFSLGFFIESIFGFGGGIIAYSILAFFFDIKQLVLTSLFIGSFASVIILASSTKHINLSSIKASIPYILAGIILGTISFKYVPSAMLLKVYSVVLIFISLRALFAKNVAIQNQVYSNTLLSLGGFIHGICGVGGPFVALGLKNKLSEKTKIRANLAFIFVSFNVVRYTQLSITNVIKYDFFVPYLYLIGPVSISIFAGHLVHKKIKQEAYEKYIYILILISAIGFLCIF